MFNSFITDKIRFIHKMKNRLQGLRNVQQLHYGQNTLHTQDEKFDDRYFVIFNSFILDMLASCLLDCDATTFRVKMK